LKKKKQTFLWQIRHAKSDAPSYLFGTMHVRDQRAFGALSVVEEKINECTAFAAEFNFEDADTSQMNGQMQLSENQYLKDLFKPKKYNRIAAFLEKQTGIDIAFFEQQKPFFIYQLITESLFQKDMPFALDRYLYEHAKAQGKILTGVETFRNLRRANGYHGKNHPRTTSQNPISNRQKFQKLPQTTQKTHPPLPSWQRSTTQQICPKRHG